MSGCHVIKGNDEPCGNYALKGKTCCYSHRKLENEPYFDEKPKNNQDQTERAVLVDEAIKRLDSDEYRCVSICRNGKRCSRFYNISYDDGNRWCGQHWIKVMNQKHRDNITEILPESKPQKDSDSESDSESNDPTYYARIKKRS
jgi:hypothetical protein